MRRMSKKKLAKIGILSLCIGIAIFIILGMVFSKKKDENTIEPMSEKFQNEQLVTLTSDDKTLNVYMPKNDLSNSDTAVVTYGQKDIYHAEEDTKSGKNYEILGNKISQIIVTTKDNTVLNYSIGDVTYSENSLKSLGTNIETFKINGLKVLYTSVNLEERKIYYEAVNLSDEHSLLIIIESNEELNVDKLKEYIERVGFEK